MNPLNNYSMSSLIKKGSIIKTYIIIIMIFLLSSCKTGSNDLKEDTNISNQSQQEKKPQITNNQNREDSNTIPKNSIIIKNRTLGIDDMRRVAQETRSKKIEALILENDNLTKNIVDHLSENFNYAEEQKFPTVRYLSFKNNDIAGLLMVDFFPNLELLNLEGNSFDSNRIHHIGFVNSLKTLFIGSNPNIIHLNNFADGKKAEESIEYLDITNLLNLTDIGELLNFKSLKTLVVDEREESLFGDVLDQLKVQGVNIKKLTTKR